MTTKPPAQRWRPTGKQYSALVGTVILLSQTFSDRPEKPTLIAAALGLFIGTPIVMKLEERRNGKDDEEK